MTSPADLPCEAGATAAAQTGTQHAVSPGDACSGPHGLREVMSLRQAAGFLQLSTDAVARLIRHGQLRAVRLGRSYRLLRSELLADLAIMSETQRRQREERNQS